MRSEMNWNHSARTLRTKRSFMLHPAVTANSTRHILRIFRFRNEYRRFFFAAGHAFVILHVLSAHFSYQIKVVYTMPVIAPPASTAIPVFVPAGPIEPVKSRTCVTFVGKTILMKGLLVGAETEQF